MKKNKLVQNLLSNYTKPSGKLQATYIENLAGEPGFEPRLTESESAVLPLNYSPEGWMSSFLADFKV